MSQQNLTRIYLAAAIEATKDWRSFAEFFQAFNKIIQCRPDIAEIGKIVAEKVLARAYGPVAFNEDATMAVQEAVKGLVGIAKYDDRWAATVLNLLLPRHIEATGSLCRDFVKKNPDQAENVLLYFVSALNSPLLIHGARLPNAGIREIRRTCKVIGILRDNLRNVVGSVLAVTRSGHDCTTPDGIVEYIKMTLLMFEAINRKATKATESGKPLVNMNFHSPFDVTKEPWPEIWINTAERPSLELITKYMQNQTCQI